ncbi:hypothetical protein [Polyangium fumosum]|uniref:Uncharacterized protein n=1 Tax=Polyangium fumosum TaxID=889272 RepID=A0A4U1JKM1_9BACT|nr:hypothetical protein [Polyangium fumosum]TKD13322.1 hypothetical protein E8A74_01885 [Polyangium fumosum]
MTALPRQTKILLAALVPLVFGLEAGCAEGTDAPLPPTTSASSSASSSSGAGGGGAGGAGGGEVVPEPDAPPVLTIVNGVNDHEAIRLCFVPYPDGGDPAPYPADPAGLAFAAAARVDPAMLLPADEDVYLYVIAGDLTKTKDLGCATLTEGNTPAGVVVAPVAVIPASAFVAKRSLLLVPTGCVGGPGHTDPLEREACGPTYSANAPNPGLLAAAMSRVTAEGHLSLQAAHAAQPMPSVDVRLVPGTEGGMPQQVAPSLTAGAVGPFPPFRQVARFELGSIAQTEILTFVPGQFVKTSASPLDAALARGGLTQADFEDGRAFTFVAVGAQPGIAAGAFWHALTWTVVRSDP